MAITANMTTHDGTAHVSAYIRVTEAYVKINPGVNYQLHLLGNDADPNDVLKMEAYGESFNLNCMALKGTLAVISIATTNELLPIGVIDFKLNIIFFVLKTWSH